MRGFRVLNNRRNEWPVTMMWYTKKKGQDIENIIDSDPDFFMWMVETFQNVTPQQANYFKRKYAVVVPEKFIQDVEPYTWEEEDPDRIYMEICDTQDLHSVLKKYRSAQLSLF